MSYNTIIAGIDLAPPPVNAGTTVEFATQSALLAKIDEICAGGICTIGLSE